MAGSERSPGGDEAALTRWMAILVIAGIVGMVALAAVTDNDAEMLPIMGSFVTAAVATHTSIPAATQLYLGFNVQTRTGSARQFDVDAARLRTQQIWRV